MLRRKCKFLVATIAVTLSLPIIGGCSQQKNSPSAENSTSNNAQDNSSLVIGLIPAESNEEMLERFEPMINHIEQEIDRSVEVFQATDYAGVIEAMKRDQVDVAWFGPLSYYLAEQEADAVPFAVGVRSNGSSTYRSIFVVPGDSPIQSLEDLKGKSVAFVDPASTSGSLVPTYMIKQKFGQMPQEFFEDFTYAGSHDAVELAVKNKSVDAGADNDITYNNMLEKGLITKNSNRIIAKSEPIPGSPLTYRDDLDEETKRQIKATILNAHKEIDVTGYGDLKRYKEATPEDYQLIRNMVQELGLKREQIVE